MASGDDMLLERHLVSVNCCSDIGGRETTTVNIVKNR